MKLRDLFVSIGFDVDDKALGRLDQGLRRTKGLIVAVGAAAVASAGMLYTMAKSVADTGDNAAKTADKLGVGIEALQELRYAAELSGIAQNNFDTALQRMTRRAAEAARGTGEAKDALRKLNVTLTDGQGRMRRSEDLLFDIADGLAKIDDPARRVALAFKLFDTEGVGMINMLAKGSNSLRDMRVEARRLGVVLSERTARDAELFRDELLRATSLLLGLKNAVGAVLLPVFNKLMIQFRQWVMLNRQVIKTRLDQFLKGLILIIGALYRAVYGAGAVLWDMARYLGGVERASKAAAWAIGLFGGAYILTAIGNLTMGIMGLVSAVKVFGNTAMVAWVKAAWLPLLVGAAVAALILILQDLYTYFTGGNSVVGVLIEAFEKKFPRAFAVAAFYVGYLVDLIKGLNAFLAGTMDYITGLLTLDWGRMTRAAQEMFAAFNPLIERWKAIMALAVDFVIAKIQPLLDLLQNVRDWPPQLAAAVKSGLADMKRAIEPYVQWLMEKIRPVVDAIEKVRGWVSDKGDAICDKVGGAWNKAKEMVGLGPLTGAGISYAPARAVNDVRINAPVTVTVPEGTPPEAVGRAVQQGVSDGIARMLRDTALATEPRVEY